MQYIILLLLGTGLLMGCAGGMLAPANNEVVIDGPKNNELPDWVNKPKKSAEFLFFMGESDPVATAQMAKDDSADKARLRALEEVWGTYLERAWKNIRARAPQMKLDSGGLEAIQDESFAKVTQEMGKAKGIIKGEIEEYIVQKWQRKDPNTQKIAYYYRGYALLKVKTNMVQDLMADSMADAAQDERIQRGKKEMNSAIDAVRKFDSADLFKESE